MIGQLLGPYQVLSKVGAGGMGEVYRARDRQLKRDVALKVLPGTVSADPERLARFQREAELLAALNHPHIAQIYGVAEQAGVRAIVMELVDGPTLGDWIAGGRGAGDQGSGIRDRGSGIRDQGSGGRGKGIPLDEALPIAQQLADAIEYAHERGVIHRDLKPANIKLTPDGAVKVLDFGLAKALAADAARATADALADSPTMTSPARLRQGDGAAGTEVGVILGTAAYMAPEQARGAAADKRADIWAFGAVLFEMLTGRPCFAGDTVTDVLAAVVKTEPDWSALPADTPPRIRELLRRCLAKDRRQRLHDIGDARLEIEEASATRSGRDTGAAPSLAAATAATGGFWSRRRALTLAAATAVVTAAAVAAVGWRLGPRFLAPQAPVVRSQLDVRPADELNAGGVSWALGSIATPGGSRTALAWVPDGSALVFVGRRGGVQQLYLRRLGQLDAQPIRGTENAQVPAVSPDGMWVAFWADQSIKRVPLTGGPAEVWAKPVKDPPFGMSWSEQGLLTGPWDGGLLGHGTEAGRIHLLTPGSGTPKPVTALEPGEVAHVLPHGLPSGKAFLFTVRKRLWTWAGDELFATIRATGARRKVLDEAVDARYAAGRLFFLRNRQLMAVPFDAEALEPRGDPVAVLGSVVQALAERGTGDVTGAGQFGVSPTGALAYVESEQLLWPPNARFVTVDRRGRETPLPIADGYYGLTVRLSPDGRQIADSLYDLRERTNVVIDVERASRAGTLGKGGEVGASRCWAPRSKRVTFQWTLPEGGRPLVWQAPDGLTDPERLGASGEPGMWTRDETVLLGLNDQDIWVLVDRGGGAGPRPIPPSPSAAEERSPTLSPGGDLLAYASDRDQSGRFEVYVQRYPDPGERVTVSTGGGDNPAWHPNGRELFFLGPADAAGVRYMMSARLQPGGVLAFDAPQRLFPYRDRDLRLASNPFTGYEVTADGDHFITTKSVAVPSIGPVTRIHLVQNWLQEVKTGVAK